MTDEGPKLFANKPKKSKLKASTTAPSLSTGATAPPPPPPLPPSPPVKEPFVQRFKFYKTLALVVSLTVGAYAFARTVLKVGPYQEEKTESPTPTTPTSSSTTPASAAAIAENPVTPPTVVPVPVPVQRPPIPEDQQRELFKWMLEEKRKVKPRDAEEKKRIDEEKAILKQFIRAKSLPTI